MGTIGGETKIDLDRCLGQYGRCLTAQETLHAIEMGTAIIVSPRVDLARIAFALVTVNRVLVFVMAKVLSGHPFFVLAIIPHPRPGKLERKNRQQKDDEESFHGPIIPKVAVCTRTMSPLIAWAYPALPTPPATKIPGKPVTTVQFVVK